MTSKTTEGASADARSEAKSLLTAHAVRTSAERMLDLALANSLENWQVRLDQLPATATRVARLTRERFPTLDLPMHSRWRHFVFGGRDLWRETAEKAFGNDRAARARAEFDLAITSVLLDAGAGPAWKYRDAATGLVASRSEGLALASLRWFESGAFSATPGDTLRADASALRSLDAAAFRTAFQVGPDNPLAGGEQRALLLNRLGATAESRPDLFGLRGPSRLGGLFDFFLPGLSGRASLPGALTDTRSDTRTSRAPAGPDNEALLAPFILETLLDALGPIWSGRPTLAGVALGDCWPHPAFGAPSEARGYVPLHKLSQWLTYSLLEPLQTAGINIERVHELTGLAEYRNGGLLVDTGVLVPRNPASLSARHDVSSPYVIEFRSLTVALLDRLVPLVTEQLGLAADTYSTARVLEGGTWAAGREVAREKRADGGPPFQISSDGTVL